MKGGSLRRLSFLLAIFKRSRRAGAMSRRDAGSGGVPQGGARFRLFVHSLGRARGAGLSSGACPFEEECIEASAAARNGTNLSMPYQAALNGPPEFRTLAAARR